MKAANKRSTASRKRRAINLKCFYELPWLVDSRNVTPASREKLRKRDWPVIFPESVKAMANDAEFENDIRNGLYRVLVHPGKDLVKRVCGDRQFALYVALVLDLLPVYKRFLDQHVTYFLAGQHALEAALSFRKDARDVMAEARKPSAEAEKTVDQQGIVTEAA